MGYRLGKLEGGGGMVDLVNKFGGDEKNTKRGKVERER